MIDAVRASGLRVAAVGVEYGWIFAEGAERQRMLNVFAESCRAAVALDCETIMSAPGPGNGSLEQAGASLRDGAEIAAENGLRLALEFNSQSDVINTLARAQEVLSIANHPACGLLLDAYHLERSGGGVEDIHSLSAGEIFYVQYSDVPRSGVQPGYALDRLPPGQGIVQFREFFDSVAQNGYQGYLSYEAPNPAAWARDPREVAREAAVATRALLA